MTSQDFVNLISINKSIRDNGFKDFAAELLQIFSYHQAKNEGKGIKEIDDQQKLQLLEDLLSTIQQTNAYGECMLLDQQ